jgi:thiamine monophosphate kinase
MQHICKESKLRIESEYISEITNEYISEITNDGNEWKVIFYGGEGFEYLPVTYCPYCGARLTD